MCLEVTIGRRLVAIGPGLVGIRRGLVRIGNRLIGVGSRFVGLGPNRRIVHRLGVWTHLVWVLLRTTAML